jgi:sucrose phosphorylase
MQHQLAANGFWIYDFALPMLLLNALYFGRGEDLKRWLDISPKRQFTTLDTHDGIGVVDVKDLLSDEEIDATKEKMFTAGANVKKIYNTAAYKNLDIYQINTTYYAALGGDDDAYLMARAIQFFAPGVPQVYYVGLLSGSNDLELLEATKNGRDINRHGYTLEEIERETKRPVFQKLTSLMKMRNTHPAFAIDGNCETALDGKNGIIITRRDGAHWAKLTADLKTHVFTIELSDIGRE